MRVLGIDPGYDRIGMAVLEKKPAGKEKLIYSECFSPPKNNKKEEKLTAIGKKIRSLVKKYNPQYLALEELFFNKNQKTALLVSEAKGIMIYEASLAGLKIHQYTPLQIKVAVTGYGRSDKSQITNMVEKLVQIKDGARLDDEYDAIAVGLTFFACFRPS